MWKNFYTERSTDCPESVDATHQWQHNKGDVAIRCYHCGVNPDQHLRSVCQHCRREICVFCLKNFYREDRTLLLKRFLDCTDEEKGEYLKLTEEEATTSQQKEKVTIDKTYRLRIEALEARCSLTEECLEKIESLEKENDSLKRRIQELEEIILDIKRSIAPDQEDDRRL